MKSNIKVQLLFLGFFNAASRRCHECIKAAILNPLPALSCTHDYENRKFEESYFDFALVLIIVALLFTPLELIAAILIIMGTRKSRQRIEDGSLA